MTIDDIYPKEIIKHRIPRECVPARCVDGSCPVALAKEHGYDVVGIPYDFDCKDCSENIEYCEECKHYNECTIVKVVEFESEGEQWGGAE